DYIEGLLEKLSQLGPERIVLTGVDFDGKELGAAAYDKATGAIDYAMAPRIEGYYHGTGDVFGSALLGALLNGLSLKESVRVAVDYTVGCISRTKKMGTDVKYGVDFERGIPGLVKELGLK
ncbi:MAG: bifunctional hydroxymethylpyrimidine kinase/phosphomethylpyrimidine kinase, partial [Bacillota bacterium]|nr:bifunctional hydroxymethylpyrimidine kinase/phosphomethylpyrimidine kinase [Bacillota bacterium]